MEPFLLSLLLIAPVYAIDFDTCYTPGPSFPPADQILSKAHFAQLSPKLGTLIADILGSHDGWKTNTTSFAVQVTTSKETIWDYFYTAPILGDYEDSRPSPVTGDTNFRIASISKTFTVYAILLENKIGLDDSITKYIPELLNLEDLPRDRGNWFPNFDQVTIRSLASQLSGISRESMWGWYSKKRIWLIIIS
jgi:CubicO group peptidase (beta-lactamase class C family)